VTTRLSLSLAAAAAACAALANAAPVTRAVAVVRPTAGNAAEGTVSFSKVEAGVRVVAEIRGLGAGAHGFHIHEWGDCSAPDGTSAGGHFNPTGEPHAGPQAEHRHTGDLGNIEVGADGVGRLDYVDPRAAFEGPNAILGRGVIVHAQADDLKTQPTGNAGGRLGCGVIGAAKSE